MTQDTPREDPDVTFTSRPARAVSALGALTAVLALGACGSDGVLTDGSVAARSGATTVSTDQVQQALKDIAPLDSDGSFKGTQVAVLLALSPKLEQAASATGAGVSDDEIKEIFRRVKVAPSAAAINTVRASSVLNSMSTGTSQQQAAANRVLQNTDVTLNPRYGTYSKGGNVRAASANWIQPQASAPAAG